jgi:hypothetical protein
MSFLSFLYRNGLRVSIPVFLLSAVLLVFFISNVVRVVREAPLLSVPLLGEQEIEFAEAGPVVLCIQGPRASLRFANLNFELIGKGAPLEGRRVWFRGRTSGISWVRMEDRSYTIPWTGRYVLQIKGLEPGNAVDSRHQIVFVRPHLGRSIGYVIGIVAASLLFIGSVVLFFLRLKSPDPLS